MSDDPWIIVPNWKKFQHYTDRQPLWIKVYTRLNSRDDWLDLSDASAGLLVRIWMAYAVSEGQVRFSRIPTGVPQKNRRRALQRLSDAGFIELSDSKPPRHIASTTRARARAREKEEVLRTSSKERASERALTGSALEHAQERDLAELLEDVSPDRTPANTNSQRHDKPRKVSPYAAAEAMTRNVGHMYPFDVFLEELSRFDVTPNEQDTLKTLWADLAEQTDELF